MSGFETVPVGTMAELEQLRAEMKARREPVGPRKCPFTGRTFWGNILHPELGLVATYGGPFDTYTIPERGDNDEEYFVHRFDHDIGGWVDGVECIGVKLVSDQEPDLRELVEALNSIRQYGADTLTGNCEGPSDKRWYSSAVEEMMLRARAAIDKFRGQP